MAPARGPAAPFAAAERMLPSLLDRLTDDSRSSTAGAAGERHLSRRALQDTVLRDLSWLFNATCLGGETWRTNYPAAFASVLNYGVPCLSGRFVSNVDVAELEQAFRQAIELFEPRIDASSLHIEPVLDSSMLDMHNRYSLIIRGLLRSQPVPLEFVLRTQIDLEEGGVTLTELPP